jgi:hypothetical protein
MPAVPDVRVTAIISTYNEADIIGQVVGNLVGQGIAVHVVDDGSTDGTRAAVDPWRSTGLVTTESLGVRNGAVAAAAHGWTTILRRKEELARSLDTDWVIHHDADEFRESPWRHLNLREGIALVDRLGYNAIDFALFNFQPTDDRFDPSVDVRETMPHYEPGANFDALQVKCWKKAPDVDLVSSGGHDVAFDGRRVFPVRFILRHYPIRSQAHGTRKVFEERRTRFSAEERARGWHVQYRDIEPGHRFLRDAASLPVFEPDVARGELLARPRGIEELTSRLDAVSRHNDALASERDARAADAKRLEVEVAQSRAREAEAHATMARLEHAYRELERHLADRQQGLDTLERRCRDVEATAADLQRQLADLKQSWSWTVTAPLRALWPRRTPSR